MGWLIMDNAVNCATMFAMFASNRRLLLHCCCCYRKCNDCRDDRYRRGKSDGPLPSSIEEPSLKTMSDFPQPHGVLDKVVESGSDDLSGDDAGNKRTSTHCDIEPNNLSKSSRDSRSRSPVYQDAAENAGYKSRENGVNYLLYLDSDASRSCWYYKSKLFWTWFLYYFCFCGARSVCKCYFCLCAKWAVCRRRAKDRRHVMKYMFGAAKKIQYNRYCARYKKGKFREMNEAGHYGRDSGTDLSPRTSAQNSPHHQATDSDSRRNDSFRTEAFRTDMLSVDSNKSIQSIPEGNEEVEVQAERVSSQVTDFKLD